MWELGDIRWIPKLRPLSLSHMISRLIQRWPLRMECGMFGTTGTCNSVSVVSVDTCCQGEAGGGEFLTKALGKACRLVAAETDNLGRTKKVLGAYGLFQLAGRLHIVVTGKLPPNRRNRREKPKPEHEDSTRICEAEKLATHRHTNM